MLAQGSMHIFYEQLWVGTDKLTVYIKIEQYAKILIVDCAKLGRRSKKIYILPGADLIGCEL
jgi:Ni,Fe-hydrogenase maturation factor